MPLSFFFVVIRFQFSDPIELVSLIVNGMEFMVRFSLVLYNFGAVRGETTLLNNIAAATATTTIAASMAALQKKLLLLQQEQ